MFQIHTGITINFYEVFILKLKKITVLTLSAILAVGSIAAAGFSASENMGILPSLTVHAADDTDTRVFLPEDKTIEIGQTITFGHSVSYTTGYTGSMDNELPQYVKNVQTTNNNVSVNLDQSKTSSGKIESETLAITGKKAGSCKVTVTFNDGTTETITVKIQGIDLSNMPTQTVIPSYTYTGKELKPTPTVKYGNTNLNQNVDYSVSYKNNIKVGTASMIVTGKGFYTGSFTQNFKIVAKNLSQTAISGIKSSYNYTGNAITPTITIINGPTKLKKDTDYTVSYKNNKSVGTATVTIKGKGNYTGIVTLKFKIVKAQSVQTNISIAKVSGIASSYKYTGKNITPTVTLKNGATTLKKGTDYIVSYKNNKAIGTATITIKGTGTYMGTITKTFKIIPKTVSLKSVASPKTKQLKVTWNKDTAATGYQITYSTSKNFKSSNKSVTINKNSTTNTTIKNLTKRKTYYVKVRAYKTVNGSKVYGSYSAVKSTKLK